MLEFKRGDTQVHEIDVPSVYVEGGMKLFFMAKHMPDDDSTDSEAVISKEFTESDIIADIDGVDSDGSTIKYKRFALRFDPSDTSKIIFGDNCSLQLRGEFELRYTDGRVVSIPNDGSFYQVVVYPDVRRGDG